MDRVSILIGMEASETESQVSLCSRDLQVGTVIPRIPGRRVYLACAYRVSDTSCGDGVSLIPAFTMVIKGTTKTLVMRGFNLPSKEWVTETCESDPKEGFLQCFECQSTISTHHEGYQIRWWTCASLQGLEIKDQISALHNFNSSFRQVRLKTTAKISLNVL